MNEFESKQNIEGLKPAASLFEERWSIFKQNQLAYFSFFFLIFLFILATVGKVLTRWIVLFDPQLVRLPEKFLPPLTPFTSRIISAEDAPMFNIYFLGTDELGRDIFARMLEGTSVSLTVGFVAVSISVFLGIFFGGIAGYYGKLRLGFVSIVINPSLSLP